MSKFNLKTTAISCLAIVATTLFANKKSNYPEGFSPKTNNGISFTENKGQIHDQHYKARPDVLFGGSDGNLTCLLYTSPSPRDRQKSRMPSSA